MWSEQIRLWEDYLRSAGAPDTTIYLRTYQLRSLAAGHRGRSPWTLDVDALALWLADHQWAPSTRRTYRASIKSFYAWAVTTGRMDRSPADQLPGISVPAGKPRPTPEDVLRRALARSDERTQLILLLSAQAGLRRGEVAQVHTAHLTEDAGGWSLRVKGKGGKTRIVPLTATLVRRLHELPPGWAFPGQISGHLSASRVGKLGSAALEGKWTLHTLRHRFASRTYAVERDFRAVQELLGHASVATTMIYTAIVDGALRRAVDAAA